MDCRKSYILLWVLFAAALVSCVLLGVLTGDARVGGGVGAVVLMAGLGQTLLFFHCPHCGALWSVRGGIPDDCPSAGKKSRTKKEACRLAGFFFALF